MSGLLGVNFSFLSGLFVFRCKFLGWVAPFGVNFSFLGGLFVFGCKLLDRVVHLVQISHFWVVCLCLDVNFLIVWSLWQKYIILKWPICVWTINFSLRVVPPTLGRVLKTRKTSLIFFYASYDVFLICVIACMYVCHEGRAP